MEILERLHFVKGLDPIADAFAGTVYTDIFKVEGEGALGIRYHGVGTTGTSTIIAQACDNVTPSNTTDVAFMYRISTTGDTWGNWTQATATGFTTTAGSSQMYEMFVPASELAAAGYGYCRFKFVEVADDPVLGGVLCAVVNPRVQPVAATVIT